MLGRKSLAVTLILVLLLSLTPAGAFASEEDYAFGADGEDIYTDTPLSTDYEGADPPLYSQEDDGDDPDADPGDDPADDPDVNADAQEGGGDDPDADPGDDPADDPDVNADAQEGGGDDLLDGSQNGDPGEDDDSLLQEDHGAEDTVAVCFSCPQAPALGGLSVWDSFGSPMAPDAKDASLYLLPPGLYTCRYHDDDGRYEDYESTFELHAGQETQYIELSLEPVSYDGLLSLVYVNPIYADVETEESISQYAGDVSENSGFFSEQRFAFRSVVAEPYDSMEDAAAEVRRQICAYEPSITVNLYHALDPDKDVNVANWKSACSQIYNLAVAHTGSPKQGDYLKYEFGGYRAGGGIDSERGAFTFVYTPRYYTSAALEEELDGIVEGILGQLDLGGKSQYHKICAIYDYICANVSYDYDHLNDEENKLKFTAYAALHDHSAICQGFSTAFYRLCLESGVDTRVVSSQGMEHVWNIVQVGDVYYELDTTFDREKTPETYTYFLKGSTYWLSSHKLKGISVIGDEFGSANFSSLYPLPADDFVHPVATVADASLLHKPALKLRFKLQLPAMLAADQNACAAFYRDGELLFTTPLSEGQADGTLTAFYLPMALDELSDTFTMKLLWGDGVPARMVKSNNTDCTAGYVTTPGGVLSQNSSNAAARSLLDYSLAAQNYFRSAGQTLSQYVGSVQVSDLQPFALSTEGYKPAGCAGASVSAVFESSVSLRVYFRLTDKDASDFSFTLDGASVTPAVSEDGCFLSVEGIGVNDYSQVHSFCISDGIDSFTVSAGVMSYADAAVSRGTDAAADLGRAMYLYQDAN